MRGILMVLRSRDNPRVRRWRRLVLDGRLRRSERRTLIEGPRLVAALLESSRTPLAVIASESASGRPEIAALLGHPRSIEPVVLADGIFREIAETDTPSGIAAEIEIPGGEIRLADAPLVLFLEDVQDAGNVGAVLRSAAAFGATAAVLSPGCADPWSPKVLRAGMGGHFQLRIADHADLAEALDAFGGHTLCAVARNGRPLHQTDLAGRIGWIFGAEGRGVSEALAERAGQRVTIPMPGGTESLNVAAAAAICLYETARSRLVSTSGAGS